MCCAYVCVLFGPQMSPYEASPLLSLRLIQG